jgi:hypothetical protein
VVACSDLSELWYKEFYLEISKEIQFPIEMSLPWILTEHILDTDAAELTEYAHRRQCVRVCVLVRVSVSLCVSVYVCVWINVCVSHSPSSCAHSHTHWRLCRSLLFPLDLYNDAAQRALHRLRARFLYDEIEAEVNLAFDQFLFKLSQNIYAHARARASAAYMSKEYKSQLEDLLAAADGRFEAGRAHYDGLWRQRHFQVRTTQPSIIAACALVARLFRCVPRMHTLVRTPLSATHTHAYTRTRAPPRTQLHTHSSPLVSISPVWCGSCWAGRWTCTCCLGSAWWTT